ncbi:MAG: FAD:protein FMN transferase [Actinobacteria bacterium]|uniref:FAD:protein FMN transferase n=1 Tax=freshwater metagenome TaxID=449393 RepID=A0A6J7ERV2_9ZZZZ|nr:FAD:protein FMN transferase [Actinomycetota bacterium]MSY12275.1 FAD:protein FMN transferase [Actinomycetota bacterium]MSZ05024.1 FAD:protein FMN transferase [Actinomycetota bacterium]MTB07071.1 FAD:protein FMN transferase [Actinomycetota bacterium]
MSQRASTATPVVRRIRPAMGTMASVHVHDVAPVSEIEAAIDELFVELDRLEALFSTFRPDSEISRINSGAIHPVDCSREVIDVLDACTWLEQASAGAFDIRRAGLAGPIDPAGFVKGWAAERAAAALARRGLEHWYVSVGGDIVVSGEPSPGERWRIGIADPFRPGSVLASLDIADGAVATSGTAERGSHLWNARGGVPPATFVSVTVMGPSLAWADAFATTVFVMGEPGIEWLAGFDGYHAAAVRADGSILASAALA